MERLPLSASVAHDRVHCTRSGHLHAIQLAAQFHCHVFDGTPLVRLWAVRRECGEAQNKLKMTSRGRECALCGLVTTDTPSCDHVTLCVPCIAKMTQHDIMFDCYVCTKKKDNEDEQPRAEYQGTLQDQVRDVRKDFYCLKQLILVLIFAFLCIIVFGHHLVNIRLNKHANHLDILQADVTQLWGNLFSGLTELRTRMNYLEDTLETFQAFNTFFKNVTAMPK